MAASEFEVPDVVADVEGFRAWRLVWLGKIPRLVSTYGHGEEHDNLWPPFEWFEAKCRHDRRPPCGKGLGCRCGIYSASTLERLLLDLDYGNYDRTAMHLVVGRITLSGKVIPGEVGWRAEKARPTHLWVPFERPEWVHPLEVAYFVPVTLARWLKDDRREED